jgi:hypothetical protein
VCIDSSAVEEAVIRISVHPRASEQQGDHHKWFYECSCTHDCGDSVCRYTMGGWFGWLVGGDASSSELSDYGRMKNVLYSNSSRGPKRLVCKVGTRVVSDVVRPNVVSGDSAVSRLLITRTVNVKQERITRKNRMKVKETSTSPRISALTPYLITKINKGAR